MDVHHGQDHVAWTWTYAMDMHHGNAPGTCTMDMVMHHGQGYAAWTQTRTWTWPCSVYMDTDMKHGHGHAEWTKICRKNMDMDKQHLHEHEYAAWTLACRKDTYMQNGNDMDMGIQHEQEHAA